MTKEVQKLSIIIIGADYVGAWGLEPPLESATGGGAEPPLRNVQKFALYRFLA